MRKKTALIITLIMCLFILCSCGAEKPEKADNGKISIVTTIFPQYDFARAIFGDKADITMLLPPASDAHSFEPTPSDVIKLINSDLFIYVGGESEEWVNDISSSAELNPEKTLKFCDIIPFSEEKTSSDNEHTHEHEYDEHVWTSVRNSMKICRAIYEKAAEIDPENKEFYEKNYNEYVNKLEKLDEEFSDITKNAKRNTIIFGDRFPFMYFANDYGLSYYAAFPGCASETEPSAATIASLTDKIREENIPTVFYIEFSNEKTADILCENTGAKKLLFHSCHNVTKEQFESGIGYVELMEQNAKNLREALN